MVAGCLMSQQHAGGSQRWICKDNCMCSHTEKEVADEAWYLVQSQYTGTMTTSSGRMAPGTRVPFVMSQVWLNQVKTPQGKLSLITGLLLQRWAECLATEPLRLPHGRGECESYSDPSSSSQRDEIYIQVRQQCRESALG